LSRTIVIKARVPPEVKADLAIASEETDWSESLIVQKAIVAWLKAFRKAKEAGK
jgi:hypothetical protein